MLTLLPTCENCNTPLPPDSSVAMICSFECTFCSNCVRDVLHNVCPNCSGGFEKRPIRPGPLLNKYPAQNEVVFKPVNDAVHKANLKANKNIPPEKR